LSKFSDIWNIDKTQYKFLAHELKILFFNFARKRFFMWRKNKTTPTLLWKIYLYETSLFILHYVYLLNISWNERICEIESRFKIVYFFIHAACRNICMHACSNPSPLFYKHCLYTMRTQACVARRQVSQCFLLFFCTKRKNN
jgi:hypothetical protein